jgi:hypothetical protein
VGHPQSLCALSQGQRPGPLTGSRRWHPCCRRCLLKGCERWFLPRWPQARYCSPVCQQAARCWRRWHASQRYRATTHGKAHRREQARRYRSRRQQGSICSDPQPPPSHVEPDPPAVEPDPPPAPDPSTTLLTPGVGQRPDREREKSWGLPCDRPGCYVVFLPTPRSPAQHFCSSSCRQALRRLRQREVRLQERQRCGARPLDRSHRGPPAVTAFTSSRINQPSL